VLNSCTCLLCFSPGRTMTFRWDRRGFPYVSCQLCKGKIFLSSGIQLANLTLLLRGIDHVAETIRREAPRVLREIYGTEAPDMAAAMPPMRDRVHEPSLSLALGGAA